MQEYDELNVLIALGLFYTLINNPGLPTKYLDLVKVKLNKNNEVLNTYDEKLMTKLIGIISKSVESDFKVRLTTLELTIKLIKKLAIVNEKCFISDFHLACIEQAREQSSFILRRHFKVNFNLNLCECDYLSFIFHLLQERRNVFGHVRTRT